MLHSLIRLVRRAASWRAALWGALPGAGLAAVACAAITCAAVLSACASSEAATGPPQPDPLPRGSAERPDLDALPESATRPTDGVFRLQLPDTLRFATMPGAAWVEALPRNADGNLVVYRALSAPALSWVVDGALFAQTLPAQRGTLRFDLQRSVGGYTDTLVVFLTLDEERIEDGMNEANPAEDNSAAGGSTEGDSTSGLASDSTALGDG